MSVNESRGNKNEPPQYTKLGHSVQRNYSGGGGEGRGGGGNTTAPRSSSSFSYNTRGSSPNTNSNQEIEGEKDVMNKEHDKLLTSADINFVIAETSSLKLGSSQGDADVSLSVSMEDAIKAKGTTSDIRYARNMTRFRPFRGGVSRNTRVQRNNSDSDKWRRVSGNQKWLKHSRMHIAERKYEAKQRQLRGIINKLTPQNFEKLFNQVNIDTVVTLWSATHQIYDMAVMEPVFCEIYANLCSRLALELPEFIELNEKIRFRRILLNICQMEFERREREDEEDEVEQTEEQREEKRFKARIRMLGNIRFIGELYKKKLLTERIIHECIKNLLGQDPDEEVIESLCTLMSTIGLMIDHPKAKEHMDVYFEVVFRLSNNTKFSWRVRFMLKDIIDLRKNNWNQPHAQIPMVFGPRVSNSNLLPFPNSQMGDFCGARLQLRCYGNQDSQFNERPSFGNRSLSIPFRPIGHNDSITLQFKVCPCPIMTRHM